MGNDLDPRTTSRDGRRPRVGVVQTISRLGDVEHNLDRALDHIESLGGEADIVVFPELFTTGYSLDKIDHRALAEPIPEGPTTRRLAAAAAQAHLSICAGLIERDGDALYDTAVVIDASGSLVARYRKTHLHPTELSTFVAGHSLTVVPLDRGIRLGIAICFEHAFPEIFAELALAGANLVAIPSAVPEGFGYLIELRSRARAQDNQLFVAAANLAGDDGETKWCGRSAIVGPRGDVLAFGGVEEETRLVAELDLTRAAAERRQEPLFEYRRPELYARLRAEENARAPSPSARSDVQTAGSER